MKWVFELGFTQANKKIRITEITRIIPIDRTFYFESAFPSVKEGCFPVHNPTSLLNEHVPFLSLG